MAQNAAFAEGIDDTMATMYTSETHFIGHAADLQSGNLTDLQVSCKAYSNLTLLIQNQSPNTCATTNPRSHSQLTRRSDRPDIIVQALQNPTHILRCGRSQEVLVEHSLLHPGVTQHRGRRQQQQR